MKLGTICGTKTQHCKKVHTSANLLLGITVFAPLSYPMELKIYKDYEALSQHTADEIIRLIRSKPDAVVCLASGDTPKLTFNIVAQKAAESKIDFSRCTFIGLDEWVGIAPDNEGSCHYFLHHHVFGPLHISQDRIHLFDALSKDLGQECRQMDSVIEALGGIDLMLVGVGMNGHIGFNEPYVSPNHYAHVVELDETTQTVGQKYFGQQTSLTRGITLGLRHLLEAKKAIMIANGTKKAEVMRKALEEAITPSMPASIMRKHENGLVMLDEGAASALGGLKFKV